jgi:ribonuclease R
MQPESLENQVLEIVNNPNYKPLKPRVFAKKLDLVDDQVRDLKKAIKRLVKRGQVMWGPGHLVMKTTSEPQSEQGLVGIFRRANAGFGFVTPLAQDTLYESDIYIPKRMTADAADGDTVRISVSHKRRGRDFGYSGRILEVVERRSNRFVGSYVEIGEYGYVRVDGAAFDSDIWVGDASAKNGQTGDKVVIEMVRFPSFQRNGEAVIIEVLGAAGKPGVDTLSIMRQYELPDKFPDSVMDDARKEAEAFDEKIKDGREDFTNWTVITIDPFDARDFDDAISLTRLENGHWQLGVHIADVSHFVRPNTAVDNEAYARATSVYLPDRVIPMLPEIISNNLASLQPHHVRYTMTAIIEFTEKGVRVATDLKRSAIKSAHRFNYEEIDEYLTDSQPWKEKLSEPVFKLVGDMHELAMILRKRRMDGGSLEMGVPEIKIELDRQGQVTGAKKVENTESHQIIEEFMLAANEAVAQELVDRELYLMRRIHETPDREKLRQLTQFIRQVGIECDSLQSRFEIKRVLEQVANKPERDAVNFAILRAMKKAIYSPKEFGHYALNMDAYCHFTSPIRRYPDLIIHRMVGSIIEGKKPASDFGLLTRLGIHCSDMERRAESAERDLVKLKLLNFLSDKIGTIMHAVISGVESYGVFASCIELPVEGLVPIENLPDDYYEFDKASRILSGRQKENQFRLGNKITLRIANVDTNTRQLTFEIEGVKKKKSNGFNDKSDRKGFRNFKPKSKSKRNR